ncbi:MAG: sulfite exporter TauE/SafE family protein [Magnetococcales bacterium]|nr:sulfite exporter TauE/SafE family protein [Magnetococcales bacterium]MBF0263557.1 sulfite exporter TauE/SafE family protein [Magnetococcales bacterium]
MPPSVVDPWLTFLAALLGSGHCIGMCGGLAVSTQLGSGVAADLPFWRWERLRLPLLYTLGRVGTYMVLGALSGWLGSMALFLSRPTALNGVPHLVVGIVMILMGIDTLGLVSFTRGTGTGESALLRWSRDLTGARPALQPLGMGILTGLLPCAMHWAFQAKAFATGSVGDGVVLLLAFGLGTIPAMWGFALLSTWLDRRARRRVLQLAGLLIVVMGAMSLRRGLMMITF